MHAQIERKTAAGKENHAHLRPRRKRLRTSAPSAASGAENQSQIARRTRRPQPLPTRPRNRSAKEKDRSVPPTPDLKNEPQWRCLNGPQRRAARAGPSLPPGREACRLTKCDAPFPPAGQDRPPVEETRRAARDLRVPRRSVVWHFGETHNVRLAMDRRRSSDSTHHAISSTNFT